jgi:predicted PurR-regulated permease PerM
MRFWLIGLVVLIAVLYLLSNILLPFVAGMAIAYFFDPVCDRLERVGLSRTLATSVVTVLFFIAFLIVLGLVLPAAAGQLARLADSLPALVENLREHLSQLLTTLQERFDSNLLARLREEASGAFGDVAGMLAGTLRGLLSSGLALVNLLSLLFLTPVVAFFLLRDWDLMVAKIDGWLPRADAETIRRLVRETDETLAGYARGVATVCLILAVFYSVALTLVGLESGLVVGLIIGAISFIPFLGAIGGLLLGGALAFFQFGLEWQLFVVAGIFIVGQALEGNVLTPKLVGDRIGLHPVIVIFALLAGGALFGFTGVLLSIPVAAVVGVLTRFALQQYLASPLYGNVSAAAEATVEAEGDRPKDGSP